jgi:hypothetical protein
MAARYQLLEPNLDRLVSAWHTDLDLSRPVEVMTDMSKSRKLGFTVYQDTRESFFDLFKRLRADRLIPWKPFIISHAAQYIPRKLICLPEKALPAAYFVPEGSQEKTQYILY